MVGLFLSVVLVFSLSTGVLAAEIENGPCNNNVDPDVTCEDDIMYLDADNGADVGTGIIDLGTNGSSDVFWMTTADSTSYPVGYYKTNTGKLVVRIRASGQKTSITLMCYGRTHGRAHFETKEIGTSSVKFEITGLLNSDSYYFVIRNNDIYGETFSGTVSAK